MKRIISILVISIYFITSLFSQEEFVKENEKIQLAMLMNHVQYSVAKIITDQDKEVLTNEFDFVINQMDKSKLYDYTIKTSYLDLLNTLSELKFKEAEKEFVIETNEIERKQAYTQAFTSFGSIFSGGFDVVSIVTSLAYTGVSAALNIANAKNQADNQLRKALFKIKQDELKAIDDIRIDLWSNWTDVITRYNIPIQYEISETEMKDFVNQLENKNNTPSTLIPILESKQDILRLFPVYWLQLGTQYQKIKNYDKAIECYNEFEKLSKNYSYLKTNPYYIELAKNRIKILIEDNALNHKSEILYYLNIISENMIPENESENRLFMASIYYTIGHVGKAKEMLNLNIARKELYASSVDMLTLIEYEENKKNKNLTPSLILELNCIKFSFDKDNKDKLIVTIPTKFGIGKFICLMVDDTYYPCSSITEDYSKDVELEYEIDFDYTEAPITVSLIIQDFNFNTIKLTYDFSYFKDKKEVSSFLDELFLEYENIEACLLPTLFEHVDSFSYNAKNDQEYVDLVKQHNFDTSKYTSKEKKSEFKKEEKEKLEDLKVNGRLRAMTNVIPNTKGDLINFPYYSSSFARNQENILVYSLKEVSYLEDKYSCDQFGLLKSSHITHPNYNKTIIDLMKDSKDGNTVAQYDLYKSYLTGNNVEKNAFMAFSYLFIAANNGNADAQYDLATIYSKQNSQLTEYFNNANFIFFPKEFIAITTVKNILKPNSEIENEKLAFNWFKKAADNNHPDAIFEVAKRYEKGLGIEKNETLAQKYYKKAYYDYGNLDAEEKIN